MGVHLVVGWPRSSLDTHCPYDRADSPLQDEKPSLAISTLSQPSPGQSNLPEEIQRLASSFPHGPPEVPIFDLQDIIQGYLPPWPRARQLRDLYLEQAPWFFGAVTQRQLYDEVFPLFYEEAAEEARARLTGGFVGSAEGFNLPIPSVTHASSHELALMLVVFCFGALTDATLPPAPHNLEAEKYYQLTKAALSLEPVMDRAPSIATVQVLSLMAIYQVHYHLKVIARMLNEKTGHGSRRTQYREYMGAHGLGVQTCAECMWFIFSVMSHS